MFDVRRKVAFVPTSSLLRHHAGLAHYMGAYLGRGGGGGLGGLGLVMEDMAVRRGYAASDGSSRGRELGPHRLSEALIR